MMGIRTTQLDLDSDVIDLGIGQPGFDLLPVDLIRQAAEIRLSEGDATLLNYGYEQGDGYFRRALAHFLEEEYRAPVTANELMTTAGASQALDMICTYFTQPGDTVFVEEPTYFLALRILADHRLNVVGLPTDEQGLVTEALEAGLQSRRPAFVYTVPTFQNPAGVTLPPERREHLLALSREYDFFVVADEVYHLLHYGGPPPPPLASLPGSERVLSIGSFSKILAPGLRLGWLQGAMPVLEQLTRSGLLDSGGGLNHFTSNVVRVVLEEGWQATYLAELRATYAKRLQTMEAALNTYLSDVAHFWTPSGGFYFWLAFKNGLAADTVNLLEKAHAQKVSFKPGIHFSSREGLRHCMRICFAFYDEEAIEQGVKRLAGVVNG